MFVSVINIDDKQHERSIKQNMHGVMFISYHAYLTQSQFRNAGIVRKGREVDYNNALLTKYVQKQT